MPYSYTNSKIFAPLSKFGVWLGISALAGHIADSIELTQALATIGITVANLSGATEVVKGIASGKLSDYYKEFRETAEFGENNQLQLAIRNGLNNAIDKLHTTFIRSVTLTSSEQTQIDLFFKSLTFQLTKEVNSDSPIDDYVQDPTAYFHTLLRKVTSLPFVGPDNLMKRGVLEPDIIDETAQRLSNFLTGQLATYASQYINEEFRTNEKAKTAYYIHLLEFGARINQQNKDAMLNISSALQDVGLHQQENTDMLRQIAKSQQRIFNAMRKLSYDFKSYVSEFDELKKRIENQSEPSLRLPNYKHLDPSFDYQYALRYTSFISREDELDELWNFLNGHSNRSLLWWTVTGPGGMGKSRLALEFCLEVQCINRYVGFVESNHIKDFDWSLWRPIFPTVIIVDYVNAHSEATRKMIGQLSRSAQNQLLPKSVRILLLEREIRESWWDSFLADRDVIENSFSSNNGGKSLNLKPFTVDCQWEIITEIHRKKKKPIKVIKEDVAQSLMAIDPEGRPLFAILAGIALAEGENIRNWNSYNLLDNLLQREQNRISNIFSTWQQDERYRKGHKNLLTLTTLCYGLTITQLRLLFNKKLTWLPEGQPDEALYKQLSAISDRILLDGTTERVYQALQPDIIGEYYVLKQLEQLLNNDFSGERIVLDLLQTAWAIAPGSIWWSIWRISTDYELRSSNRAYNLVLESQPEPGSPEITWEYWGAMQANLGISSKSIAKSESICNKLKKLSLIYKQNQAIKLQQVVVAYSLMNRYANQQSWVKAEEYYGMISSIQQASLYNEEITSQLAKGSVNLLTAYGTHKHWIKAELIYANLLSLAYRYYNVENVVQSLALGTNNLIVDFGRNSVWDKAEDYYLRLHKFSNDFIGNKEIQFNEALGAFNLIIAYAEYGRMSETRIRYEDIKKLVIDSIDSVRIAIVQSKAANNLINFHCTLHQLNDAIEYYKDLKLLRNNNSNNYEIVLRQAMGGANLVLAFCKIKQLNMAKSYCREIQDLSSLYPYKEELSLTIVKGINWLTISLITHKMWGKAYECYDSLQTFGKLYESNSEIIVLQAQIAGSLLYQAPANEKTQRRSLFLSMLLDLERILSKEIDFQDKSDLLPALNTITQTSQWLKFDR